MAATDKVTEYVNGYDDWRGELLKKLRVLINNSAPELTEDFKWGVPVWTHNGLVVAISAFKDHVKINFLKGAFLDVPQSIFNSGLDSKVHRSINYGQGDKIDKPVLIELVRAAVTHNKK